MVAWAASPNSAILPLPILTSELAGVACAPALESSSACRPALLALLGSVKGLMYRPCCVTVVGSVSLTMSMRSLGNVAKTFRAFCRARSEYQHLVVCLGRGLHFVGPRQQYWECATNLDDKLSKMLRPHGATFSQQTECHMYYNAG